MSLIKFANNLKCKLLEAVTSNATTILVSSPSGFSWPVLEPGDTMVVTCSGRTPDGVVLWEIMQVTAITVFTATQSARLDVVRGHEGTSASNFPPGSTVENRLTAGTLNQVANAANFDRDLLAALESMYTITNAIDEAEQLAQIAANTATKMIYHEGQTALYQDLSALSAEHALNSEIAAEGAALNASISASSSHWSRTTAGVHSQDAHNSADSAHEAAVDAWKHAYDAWFWYNLVKDISIGILDGVVLTFQGTENAGEILAVDEDGNVKCFVGSSLVDARTLFMDKTYDPDYPDTRITIYDEVASKAYQDDVYLKTETYSSVETDALLDLKADWVSVYLRTEIDAFLALKADKATTYTKTETDALLDLKADADSVYTKTESDGRFVAIKQGTTHASKYLGVNAAGDVVPIALVPMDSNATATQIANADSTYDYINTKVAISQGTDNNGNFLGIVNGNVTPLNITPVEVNSSAVTGKYADAKSAWDLSEKKVDKNQGVANNGNFLGVVNGNVTPLNITPVAVTSAATTGKYADAKSAWDLSETKVDKLQGTANSGKFLGIVSGAVTPVDITPVAPSSASTLGQYADAKGTYDAIQVVAEEADTANDGLLTKVDKSQGTINSGKFLGIDATGTVTPLAIPTVAPTSSATTGQIADAKSTYDWVENLLTAAVHYKGQVATEAGLPTTNQTVGDYWMIVALSETGRHASAIWNGTGWDINKDTVSDLDGITLGLNDQGEEEVLDGAITNAKVAATAAIAQSKIAGLTDALDSKVNILQSSASVGDHLVLGSDKKVTTKAPRASFMLTVSDAFVTPVDMNTTIKTDTTGVVSLISIDSEELITDWSKVHTNDIFQVIRASARTGIKEDIASFQVKTSSAIQVTGLYMPFAGDSGSAVKHYTAYVNQQWIGQTYDEINYYAVLELGQDTGVISIEDAGSVLADFSTVSVGAVFDIIYRYNFNDVGQINRDKLGEFVVDGKVSNVKVGGIFTSIGTKQTHILHVTSAFSLPEIAAVTDPITITTPGVRGIVRTMNSTGEYVYHTNFNIVNNQDTVVIVRNESSMSDGSQRGEVLAIGSPFFAVGQLQSSTELRRDWQIVGGGNAQHYTLRVNQEWAGSRYGFIDTPYFGINDSNVIAVLDPDGNTLSDLQSVPIGATFDVFLMYTLASGEVIERSKFGTLTLTTKENNNSRGGGIFYPSGDYITWVLHVDDTFEVPTDIDDDITLGDVGLIGLLLSANDPSSRNYWPNFTVVGNLDPILIVNKDTNAVIAIGTGLPALGSRQTSVTLRRDWKKVGGAGASKHYVARVNQGFLWDGADVGTNVTIPYGPLSTNGWISITDPAGNILENTAALQIGDVFDVIFCYTDYDEQKDRGKIGELTVTTQNDPVFGTPKKGTFIPSGDHPIHVIHVDDTFVLPAPSDNQVIYPNTSGVYGLFKELSSSGAYNYYELFSRIGALDPVLITKRSTGEILAFGDTRSFDQFQQTSTSVLRYWQKVNETTPALPTGHYFARVNQVWSHAQNGDAIELGAKFSLYPADGGVDLWDPDRTQLSSVDAVPLGAVLDIIFTFTENGDVVDRGKIGEILVLQKSVDGDELFGTFTPANDGMTHVLHVDHTFVLPAQTTNQITSTTPGVIGLLYDFNSPSDYAYYEDFSRVNTPDTVIIVRQSTRDVLAIGKSILGSYQGQSPTILQRLWQTVSHEDKQTHDYRMHVSPDFVFPATSATFTINKSDTGVQLMEYTDGLVPLEVTDWSVVDMGMSVPIYTYDTTHRIHRATMLVLTANELFISGNLIFVAPVDDVTIEYDEFLQVKDAGITTAKIADGAITNNKVSATAAIAMTKISGLSDALSSKVSLDQGLANKEKWLGTDVTGQVIVKTIPTVTPSTSATTGQIADAKSTYDTIVSFATSAVHYKGTVATEANLPIAGMVTGDYYNVTNYNSSGKQAIAIYNGSAWDFTFDTRHEYDDVTIGLNDDGKLQIADAGITNAKIADGAAIDQDKIARLSDSFAAKQNIQFDTTDSGKVITVGNDGVASPVYPKRTFVLQVLDTYRAPSEVNLNATINKTDTGVYQLVNMWNRTNISDWSVCARNDELQIVSGTEMIAVMYIDSSTATSLSGCLAPYKLGEFYGTQAQFDALSVDVRKQYSNATIVGAAVPKDLDIIPYSLAEIQAMIDASIAACNTEVYHNSFMTFQTTGVEIDSTNVKYIIISVMRDVKNYSPITLDLRNISYRTDDVNWTMSPLSVDYNNAYERAFGVLVQRTGITLKLFGRSIRYRALPSPTDSSGWINESDAVLNASTVSIQTITLPILG